MTRLDTYDEDRETDVEVKGRIRLLVLGVQHIILVASGENRARQELSEDSLR